MTLQSIFWCTIHSTLCKLKSNFPDCANQKERERKKISWFQNYMICTARKNRIKNIYRIRKIHSIFCQFSSLARYKIMNFKKIISYFTLRKNTLTLKWCICYFTNFETRISDFPKFCYITILINQKKYIYISLFNSHYY